MQIEINIDNTEGFLVAGEEAKPMLEIALRYYAGRPVIEKIERISKPGLRRYSGSQEIPRVLGGMGISILTTSRGVMTGHEAKKANVGGEILAYVW